MNATARPYRRFVPACTERGIGRTTAFSLAKQGLLETFKLRRMTFVYTDTLDRLPERIAERDSGKAGAQ